MFVSLWFKCTFLELNPSEPFNMAVHFSSQSTRFFFSLRYIQCGIFILALLTADEVNGFITVPPKEYGQSSFYPLDKTFRTAEWQRDIQTRLICIRLPSVLLERQLLDIDSGPSVCSCGRGCTTSPTRPRKPIKANKAFQVGSRGTPRCQIEPFCNVTPGLRGMTG